MNAFHAGEMYQNENRGVKSGRDCSCDSRWEMIPSLLSQESPDWIRGSREGHARKLRRGKVAGSEHQESIEGDNSCQEISTARACSLINKSRCLLAGESPANLKENADPGPEAFECHRGRATRKFGEKERVGCRSPCSRIVRYRVCGRTRRCGLLWATQAFCIILFSLGGWCQVSRDSGWGMRSGDQRRSLSLDSEVEALDDYFLSGKQKPGKRIFADSYPGVVREASANFQTVDDLVYNHFLIHSLGGGGWWWGGRSRSQFADVLGEDPICALHHKEIRASQKDHNVTRTESCARSHIGMLWRGRYLFGDKVVVAEDGSTALRAAKDYHSKPLPGALVFLKFFRDKEDYESEQSLMSWIEQEQPGIVARTLEAFEVDGDQIVDPVRKFLLVLEGGRPLPDLVALNDVGNGISREIAVSILSQAAKALSRLTEIGLELSELSAKSVMIQDDGSAKIFDVSSAVVVSGRASPSPAVAKAMVETPLCLPEKSFGVGDSGAVWAYKNVAYLMMARPGHVLFSCGRSQDENVQRASTTLQTTRLYMLQIRVQGGPSWLPDPSSSEPGASSRARHRESSAESARSDSSSEPRSDRDGPSPRSSSRPASESASREADAASAGAKNLKPEL